MAVFRSLDIGIAQRIGNFRAEAAFYRRPADQRSENHNVCLHLPQRFLTLYGNTRAERYAALEHVLITDVSVSHHLEHSPLREIHLVPVPLRWGS